MPKPSNGDNESAEIAKIGKIPTLIQTRRVQRNPFVPESVEPRPDVTIVAHADPTKEYVPSGTHGYMPFLRAQPQYIDDLTSQFGLDVYDRMKTDPIVYSSERVFTLAILGNGYELMPALSREESDYDTAVKMRDFVQENIDHLETPYDVILEQHLNAFEYGCAVNEQIYTTEGSKLWLKDIRDKPLQNAVFIVDSYNQTIGIMTQRFPGQIYPAGSYISIPLALTDKQDDGVRNELNRKGEFDISKRMPGFLPRDLFSILTNEMRFNDERGRSGLRAAYSAWWFKQQIMAEYLSYLSKFGSPSLVGETAEGAVAQTMLDDDGNPLLDADDNPLVKTPEKVLSEALASFQNGSAIAVPFGAKVSAIAVAGDGQAFAGALNWANSEMVRGITYQYLATSEGAHQARASSETHQDILSLGILRRKRWLANQQRREVYARLLRYNFDLSGKKIERYVPNLNLGFGDGFPYTPQSIAQLASAGFLDDSQKERIDEHLGLPKRELITVNGVKMTPSQKLQRDDQETARQDALAQQQGQAGGANNNTSIEETNQMKAALNTAAMLAVQGRAPQTVVIPPSHITVNLPDQKAPEIHIDAALRLPDNFTKAMSPNVIFQMPEQTAPIVNVNVRPTPVFVKNNVKPTPVTVQNSVTVPEQPAPVVNVSLPKETQEILEIERGPDDLIKRVVKKFAWGKKE